MSSSIFIILYHTIIWSTNSEVDIISLFYRYVRTKLSDLLKITPQVRVYNPGRASSRNHVPGDEDTYSGGLVYCTIQSQP